MNRLSLVLIAAVLMAARLAFADAGILIPGNREQPDAHILSLEDMHIDVRIDNGDARVSIRQIYANHTSNVLEGNYIFSLPANARVSDFAVWDDVVRIPGVILERKRAGEIYDALKWQSIDPGLLQMGERTAEEAARSSVFSARITPIPAYGLKRVEIEYHETLPVEELQSYFAVPLRPEAYQVQTAAHLTIQLDLISSHPLQDFEVASKTYPLKIAERAPGHVSGSFSGDNVTLNEDLAVRYTFDATRADSLRVLTYRNPRPEAPPPDVLGPAEAPPVSGYFEASALFGSAPVEGRNAQPGGPPRTVIALFDTSLSMQWDKLDRSYRALEALLESLRSEDRFNVLLFNTETRWFSSQPVAADRDSVVKALDFVRQSYIQGGTNLQRALASALAPEGRGPNPCLVLLSDGDPTRGLINNARLAAWYANQAPRVADRPRLYAFAIGDDADLPLLKMLTKNNGVLEWVRSTEPIDFKLHAFLDKLGRNPISQLAFAATPEDDFDLVYPLEASVFPGSLASWVGEYEKPLREADFTVRGNRHGQPIALSARVPLPAEDLAHPGLARTWARARVDALLAKIQREGEDQATVDEIIRLSRQYKFVTPYTSFLAAPRALLRPRVIRPGDPVLRVKADPSIVSIIAFFPFGPIRPLRYLGDEDIWQTRFLTPDDLADGAYSVRLVMRDREGNVYRESKSFVIASHPPVVRVKLDGNKFHRGAAIPLRVSASQSTRTIVARMYGVPPVYLTWKPEARSNTGVISLPPDLPAGDYKLTVTAEDFAHNVGSAEVTIEVLP